VKHTTSLRKRLLCSALTVLLVGVTPLSVSAETLEEIQAQQDQLEAENQELQSQLDSLREDEAQKQEYQDTLQQQISVVQEQILITRQNIEDLNDSIQELTLKLDKSQEAVQDTIDQFKERLVAIYTAGNVSTLEILLDSHSLSDFTTRMAMLDTMTAHDQKIIDTLEAYAEKTQADREELQAKKEEVAKLQVTLEGKQEELDALYEENRAALGEIQGQLYATENQMEINEAELAEGEAKIQAAIEAQKKAEEEAKKKAEEAAEQQGGNSSSQSPVVNPPSGGGGGSGFDPIWPMPGVTYISCPYGGYSGHKGMDIAGPWGTPIVAAADGQVIEANNYDSWGYSWGYYVLIYHNGTYSTRYAHLSSVAVSTGQYVTAGTIIGYEGETGNAYGAHLHFEVYENGIRVDPARFL
jgi:murein DD-endopeptidase MepM/ murein hydrolase activator NlpD